MNREELRIKLLKFINNFSYVIPDSKIQAEMVDLALEECRDEQVESFEKKSLSALKKLIKDKINDLYLKDRDFLFKNAIRNISSSEFSENDKIKLLSILVSSISEPIEVEFYKKLVHDNKYLKDIFSPFFIDIDGNIYENDELKELFPKVLGMYYEYIRENNINICVEKLDPNDERRVLSREEVKNLYKRIRMGDKDAKEQLIIHNMRLVKKIAYWYIPSGIDYEDLVQEGVIGLNIAIDRFDPDKDFAFSTYATHWIRQVIKRYTDDHSRIIRIPVHKRDWMIKIAKKVNELDLKFGGRLSKDELAEKLGISLKQLQEFYDLSRSIGSLNQLVPNKGGDQDTEIGDFVADPTDEYDALLTEISNSDLRELLKNTLNPRIYRIVLLRTGLLDGRVRTLEEVGQEIGITRERVRQLEAKAFKKLEKHPYIKALRPTNSDSKGQNKGGSIEPVKLKTFKDLMDERYDSDTQKKIMEFLTEDELAILKRRYGPRFDAFIESDDKEMIASIRTLIHKTIPERLATKDIGEKELIDKKCSDKPKDVSPFIVRLRKKFSQEEIDYIINNINEEDLIALKDLFGENLDTIHTDIDSSSQNNVHYIIHKLFPKRIRHAKANFGDDGLKIKSFKELLKYECSSDRVTKVLESLTSNERRLLVSRYGDTFDELHEVDDIRLIAKVNTLVQKILKEEVARRALIIDKSPLLVFLSSSYSVEEIKKILPLLSFDDKELLKSRYGENFNQYVSKGYFLDTERVSRIILVKIPKLIGKPLKVKEPNIERYNCRGLTLREKLSKKYTDEEINYVLSTLTEEENKMLVKYYGESLDERADNLQLGDDVSALIQITIPTRLSLFKNGVGRNVKRLSLMNRLKEKYTDEEIKYIFNTITESQLYLLKLNYGENLDEVITGLGQSVQQKVYTLINSTMRRNIEEVKACNNGLLKVKTLRESLQSKYCNEQIDSLVASLSLEKRELLIKRFGTDFDEINELDDINLIAKVNSLVLDLFKANFSKKALNKNAKTFMVILKENYSLDEIQYILSTLSEDETTLLKLRYGDNFDNLYFVSSIDTRNEIYNLVSKVIPKRVDELRNSEVAEKQPKVKYRKLSLIENLSRVYSSDEIKTIISSLTDEQRALLKLRYGENFDQFLKIDDKAQIKHINYFVSNLLRKKNSISQIKDKPKKNHVPFIIKLKEKYTDDEIKYIMDNLSESERNLLTLRYGENFDEFFSLDDKKLINRINFLCYGSIPKRIENYRNHSVIDEKEKKKVLSKRTLVSRLKKQYSDDEIQCIFSYITEEELSLLQKGYGDDLTCCKPNLDKSLTDKIYRLISHDFRKKIEHIKQENNGELKIYTLMELMMHNLSDEEVVTFFENLTDEDKSLLEARYGKSFNEIVSIDDMSVVAKINSLVQSKIMEFRKDKRVMKRESFKIKIPLIDKLKRTYSDSEIKNVLDNLSDSEREMLTLRYGENFDQYNEIEDKKLRLKIHNFINNTLLKRIEKHNASSSKSGKKKSLLLYERLSSYYSKEEIECIFSYITEEELSLLQKGYGDDLASSDINLDTSLRCKTYRLINNGFRKKLDFIRKENNGVLKDCTLMENLRKRNSIEQIQLFFDSLSSEERELLVSRYGESFDEIIPINDIRIVARINSLVESHLVNVKNSKRNKNSVKKRVSFIDKLKEKYSDEEIKYILDNLSESERNDLTLRYGERFDQYHSVEDESVINRIKFLLYGTIPKRVEKYRNPSVKDKGRNALSLYKRLSKYYSKEEIECIFSYITEEELSLLQKGYGEDLINSDINLDASLRKKTYLLIKNKFKKKLESIRQENNGSLRVCTLMENLRKRFSEEQIQLFFDSLSSEERELLVCRYGESFDEIIPNDDIRVVARINSLIEDKFAFECSFKNVIKTRNRPLIDRLKEKYSDSQIKEILDSLTPEQIELLKSRYGENFDEFHKIEDKKQVVKVKELATKIVSGKYLLKKVPVSVTAVDIPVTTKEEVSVPKRKISNLKTLNVPVKFSLKKGRASLFVSSLPKKILVPSKEELVKLNDNFRALVSDDSEEVSERLSTLGVHLKEIRDTLVELLDKIEEKQDGKIKTKKIGDNK